MLAERRWDFGGGWAGGFVRGNYCRSDGAAPSLVQCRPNKSRTIDHSAHRAHLGEEERERAPRRARKHTTNALVCFAQSHKRQYDVLTTYITAYAIIYTYLVDQARLAWARPNTVSGRGAFRLLCALFPVAPSLVYGDRGSSFSVFFLGWAGDLQVRRKGRRAGATASTLPFWG